MSQFRRSGHYRTNSYGTRFYVREHDVSRDEWGHAGPQQARIRRAGPEPAEPISASTGGLSYLTPNAYCPVCGDKVWFLQAWNGGRVFFDTVWPDWDKHPCTISEDATPLSAHEYWDDVQDDPHVYNLEIYPRLKGTIIRLQRGLESFHFKAEIDITKKLFDTAWYDGTREGRQHRIRLLTADLEPLVVTGVRVKEPKSLSEKERRAIADTWKTGLIKTARRIEGLKNGALGSHPSVGFFITGTVDERRAIVVPLPADQTTSDNSGWDRKYGGGSWSDTAEYIRDTYNRILALLPSPERRISLSRDVIVFAIYDTMNRLNQAWEGDEDWLSDQPETVARSRRPIIWDDVGFTYSYTLSADLMKTHTGIWADISAADPIIIPSEAMTVDDALAIENAYCRSRWPQHVDGQFRQLEALSSQLGFAPLFRLLVAELRKIGMAPHGSLYGYRVSFSDPDGVATLDEVALLFHRSSPQDGLWVTIVPGYGAEETTLESSLHRIRDERDIVPLVRRLGVKGPRD